MPQVLFKAKVPAQLKLCKMCRRDSAKADTQALADVLAAQGLPAHLEVWGGDVSHEWYWWGKKMCIRDSVKAVVAGSPKYVYACSRCLRAGKVTRAV